MFFAIGTNGKSYHKSQVDGKFCESLDTQASVGNSYAALVVQRDLPNILG